MSSDQPKKFNPLLYLRNWYARFERPISSLSLIGGFVFDALTLRRVDQFWENFWVVIHLLIVAICIVLINREETEGADSINAAANPAKLHFWLVNVMQFFFGGLLSTFIVFYFRSAVLAVAWPFFVILFIAFAANESFKKQYARKDFQISFLFLCIYLFAIFFVPLLTHDIGPVEFLVSGGISVVVLLLFLWILKLSTKRGLVHGKKALVTSVVTIFIVVNGLYFLNLIPPLPLSLQDAGIFHSIARTADGNYSVTYEPGNFWNRFLKYVDVYPTYHSAPGQPIYAYSAIFSPIAFNIQIVHVWQEYSPTEKKWVTVNKVPLSVVGGREEGFRTYSIDTGLTTGKWRVNVETPSGQLIGRMAFSVVVDTPPASLDTEVK
jgi:hypothetical protein